MKHLFITVCLLLSLPSMGHSIYAPNDIQLLDNRFRIDPETEQATFIFNHSKGAQHVVLVQPDGTKLYQQRHPHSVAWTSSNTQNIVTIQNPMPGPWQAIAALDSDNRIKILSTVNLNVSRLPLKLYEHEYITTHATLYEGDKRLTNPAYLKDAALTVTLIGNGDKQLALYQDDGKYYDKLAFDGELTTRLYVNLKPGRYLLSISTKNDVFIRNVNKDAVVFPTPIRYRIEAAEHGSKTAKFTLTIDGEAIDPESLSIKGVIKDQNNEIATRVIIHSMENDPIETRFSVEYNLAYDIYTFSGKAYATTRDGREIELNLPVKFFELDPPYKSPEPDVILQGLEKTIDVNKLPASASIKAWVLTIITLIFLALIAIITFLIVKRKKEKQKSDELSIDELNWEELQPTPIDIEDAK